MRKTHYKVVLDVFVYEDDLADMCSKLGESGFIIDPEQDATDTTGDIIDITTEEVEVTDSR